MKLLENKIFKIAVSCVFAAAVLIIYLIYCIEGNLFHGGLAYSCIALSFVFSLLFVRLTAKKVFVTCALAVNCVADYFLIISYHLSYSKTDQLLGVIFFCIVQLIYAVYTYFIIKRMSLKIVMLASRGLLSALVAILLPVVLKLGALEVLSVIYILNSFISLVVFAVNMKTEWLTFIGFLFFFICDIFVGLTNGAAPYFGISGEALQLLSGHNYSIIFYIPGIFLISLSAVWEVAKGRIPLPLKPNQI